MASEVGNQVATADTLDVLVFTVGEVYCGIDGELVDRMLVLAEVDEETMKVRWFHQGLSFGDRKVVYLDPKAVTLKGIGEECALVIDQPRDLVRVPIRQISPLPHLFGMRKGFQAFWGSFVLDDKVVLLLDPYRLFR